MDLNMEPGVDFVDQLEEAVGSCAVLLVIMGRSWLGQRDASGARRLDSDGDYVRSEVASALARGIRVVPVLVGGAVDALARGAAAWICAPLARRNAIELSDGRWTHDVDRALERVLERIIVRRTGDGAGSRGAAAPVVGQRIEARQPPGRAGACACSSPGSRSPPARWQPSIASGSEPQQSDASQNARDRPRRRPSRASAPASLARRAQWRRRTAARQVAPPPIVHPPCDFDAPRRHPRRRHRDDATADDDRPRHVGAGVAFADRPGRDAVTDIHDM